MEKFTKKITIEFKVSRTIFFERKIGCQKRRVIKKKMSWKHRQHFGGTDV